MWLEAVSQPTDHAHKCPTCGGGVRRRVHGEMHAGSSILDGERVDIRRSPAAGYADPIVLDTLTQYFDGGLYRSWPSERYLSRGGKKLHREVWRVAFGDIPAGCHIHHRDSNPANNALGNLECIPASIHARESRKKRRSQRHFTAAARRKAKQWHQSEAGLLWHRRHGERMRLTTKRVEKSCVVCSQRFTTIDRVAGRVPMYCSESCRVSAYRKRKKAQLLGKRMVLDRSRP